MVFVNFSTIFSSSSIFGGIFVINFIVASFLATLVFISCSRKSKSKKEAEAARKNQNEAPVAAIKPKANNDQPLNGNLKNEIKTKESTDEVKPQTLNDSKDLKPSKSKESAEKLTRQPTNRRKSKSNENVKITTSSEDAKKKATASAEDAKKKPSAESARKKKVLLSMKSLKKKKALSAESLKKKRTSAESLKKKKISSAESARKKKTSAESTKKGGAPALKPRSNENVIKPSQHIGPDLHHQNVYQPELKPSHEAIKDNPAAAASKTLHHVDDYDRHRGRTPGNILDQSPMNLDDDIDIPDGQNLTLSSVLPKKVDDKAAMKKPNDVVAVSEKNQKQQQQNVLKPRQFSKNEKEQWIDILDLRCAPTDYPTMADVVSDWDTQKTKKEDVVVGGQQQPLQDAPAAAGGQPLQQQQTQLQQHPEEDKKKKSAENPFAKVP